MRYFFNYVFLVIFSLLFAGCYSQKVVYVSKYIDDDIIYDQLVESVEQNNFEDNSIEIKYAPVINYNALSNTAVSTIFDKVSVINTIIVTDFVNLTNLDNKTKLGYVLSNNIKNSLINIYKANIIEAEVSKHFSLSKDGLKILSRDLSKIKSTIFNVEKAVVGTYTFTDKELIVFVKLINLKTGVIEGSYSRTLPMTESVKMLLNEQ